MRSSAVAATWSSTPRRRPPHWSAGCSPPSSRAKSISSPSSPPTIRWKACCAASAPCASMPWAATGGSTLDRMAARLGVTEAIIRHSLLWLECRGQIIVQDWRADSGVLIAAGGPSSSRETPPCSRRSYPNCWPRRAPIAAISAVRRWTSWAFPPDNAHVAPDPFHRPLASTPPRTVDPPDRRADAFLAARLSQRLVRRGRQPALGRVRHLVHLADHVPARPRKTPARLFHHPASLARARRLVRPGRQRRVSARVGQHPGRADRLGNPAARDHAGRAVDGPDGRVAGGALAPADLVQPGTTHVPTGHHGHRLVCRRVGRRLG